MGELVETLAAFFLLMLGVGVALVVIGRAGYKPEPRGMQSMQKPPNAESKKNPPTG